jgi:hypothetical protein
VATVRGSGGDPRSLCVSFSCSPRDQADRTVTPPVNRLAPLLRLLDVLGELLKESFGPDPLPAVGLVIAVIPEVPEAVDQSALEVRCLLLLVSSLHTEVWPSRLQLFEGLWLPTRDPVADPDPSS